MRFELIFSDFDVMMEEKMRAKTMGFNPIVESHDLTEDVGSFMYSMGFDSDNKKSARDFFNDSEDVYKNIDDIKSTIAEWTAFHDCSGEFSTPEALIKAGPCPDSKGIGSKNDPSVDFKQQVTGVSEKGKAMFGRKFGKGGKDPCGRDARKQGLDIPCYSRKSKKRNAKSASAKFKERASRVPGYNQG